MGTKRRQLIPRRTGAGLATVVMVASLSVVAAKPAAAFVGVIPAPSFPPVLEVGNAAPASLGIGNFSTPPESTQFPVLTITAINLVPSCRNSEQDCAGGVDVGVFSLSSTGVGNGPTSCTGTWTITQTTPGVFRFVPPGGENTLQLATSEFCVVDFVVTSLKLPVDVNPAEAGAQTNQLASVTPRSSTVTFTRASGLDQTTVEPGTQPPPQSPIAVFRPTGGLWFIHDGPTVHWGTSGDIAVSADYDGNGTDDIAVFRPSNGVWFVRNGPGAVWGQSGDVPVPADYDGDGDGDIAVFRPSNGAWYVMGGPGAVWGSSGDIPVPADYDGDGDDDIAVYRPLVGAWLVANGAGTFFGTLGDIPVPADYDGNGTDEVAVFRPLTGEFLVQSGVYARWGTSGDIPVPADYDFDGDDDIAVFRPSNGVWFVHGGPALQWGTNGDDPLPLPASVREAYFP